MINGVSKHINKYNTTNIEDNKKNDKITNDKEAEQAIANYLSGKETSLSPEDKTNIDMQIAAKLSRFKNLDQNVTFTLRLQDFKLRVFISREESQDKSVYYNSQGKCKSLPSEDAASGKFIDNQILFDKMRDLYNSAYDSAKDNKPSYLHKIDKKMLPSEKELKLDYKDEKNKEKLFKFINGIGSAIISQISETENRQMPTAGEGSPFQNVSINVSSLIKNKN